MEIKEEKLLQITLKDKDAENFKSAMKKISDTKSIGFNKQTLSEDESKTIKDLNEKL